MDISDAPRDNARDEEFVVRADEVDQTGTAISTERGQDALPLSAIPFSRNDSAPALDLRPLKKATGSTRPGLRREGSAPPPPPPPLQPPPPAPDQSLSPENPTDSLSLPQLKHLVSQFPKTEERAYAFEYADSQSTVPELNEWFGYTEQDRLMLFSVKDNFEHLWNAFCKDRRAQNHGNQWIKSEHSDHQEFFHSLLSKLSDPDVLVRIESLEAVFYILAGVWGETAGLPGESQTEATNDDNNENVTQILWIQKGTELVNACSGVTTLFDHFYSVIESESIFSKRSNRKPREEQDEATFEFARDREITVALSVWYFLVETARSIKNEEVGQAIRNAIASLEPNFLALLLDTIAGLRWNESSNLPDTRLLLLFWKSVLLLFGDTNLLEQAKKALNPDSDPKATSTGPVLTASPLDYHLFRQEITSKYPAYNPPPPLIPLELEHKSILPPLPHHVNRPQPTAGPLGPGDGSGSIFHQPVHIATPAPSPPPSPVGPGGKAGKKQNYQTNQYFPFLYPPLDGSSNNIGGKGSSDLQDHLVGRKWEGSDVPASIIEAGQLFASRMRMTRALRQLWRERELFIKYDRGWAKQDKQASVKNRDIGTNEVPKREIAEDHEETDVIDDDISHMSVDDPNVKASMKAVEDFYHRAMPNLQSFVMFIMKMMLSSVQVLAAQGAAQGGAGETNGVNGIVKNRSNLSMSQQGSGLALGGIGTGKGHDESVPLEELENTRLREVLAKAISGSLFLMLKWFKLSHILKFEFLTQLLLDCSYVPVLIKWYQLQNIEDTVAQQFDRDDLSFFHFCHINSEHPPASSDVSREEDEPTQTDDAAHPPISDDRLQSSNPDSGPQESPPTQEHSSTSDESSPPAHPSVDELGNPLAPLPADPITVYSWRNFYSTITFLRILHKITSKKSHRCALLVTYKSSLYLRKLLKIPDPTLRLYTLKLVKSQVPYCSRKWRQSNMRVITAIYLHCRPELRDEWLAGLHDQGGEGGEEGESLALEQALRALTHWWHLRCYRDVMETEDEDRTRDSGEEDFFQKELEALGWGLPSGGEEMGFEGEAQAEGGSEWEGGPLRAEGW